MNSGGDFCRDEVIPKFPLAMMEDDSEAPGGQSMYEEDIMADQYAFDGDHIPTSSSTEQRHFIARECVEMNCNWGIAGVTGKAGACWQCHHAEPCCGEPCNAAQCCYCCFCVSCCTPCVTAKMLAYSLDQECFCVNHCGAVLLFGAVSVVICATVSTLLFLITPSLLTVGISGGGLLFILSAIIRHNIRLKYNVGYPSSWIGDLFMSCCFVTAPCSLCQELRAIPIEGWDWLADLRARGFNCLEGATLGRIIRF